MWGSYGRDLLLVVENLGRGVLEREEAGLRAARTRVAKVGWER